ncbi:MAG: ATP-binding protein [Tepidiformaceae bacterium]
MAGSKMRMFGKTFRVNLVAAGVPDDDDDIWRIVSRFLILEFDFESSAPLARTHSLFVAQQVLSPEDAPRAEALWSNLIEISLERAKTGGAIERTELREMLTDRGFRFAGDRDFSVARAKLAEMSRHALDDIGDAVAGVRLPRLQAVEALDQACDLHHFVEIRGGPGVGKSAVLKHVAERISCQAHVLVLDPVGTPEGGWGALSQVLSIPATAREFLNDLAASGGGVVFIDSLEMFTSPARRRTVNDVLREVAVIEGFSVVATARLDFGSDGDNWLAHEAVSALGPTQLVIVGELDDEEVATLREHTPELRALLAPGHPAAGIARNLYRLSRLLKVPSSTTIRSEAALADSWWRTADYAEMSDRRAAQRLIVDLADAALAGCDLVEAHEDSPARSHLLRSQTLIEPKRDHLRFYHDVLRDWAVGARLHDDLGSVVKLDLTSPVSAKVARGIQFAGRFALELTSGCEEWTGLLARLSPAGSHSSWRRQALTAIVHSERSSDLLERCGAALLSNDGALLIELCVAITAVETVSPTDIAREMPGEAAVWAASIPKDMRIAFTASAPRLLGWCIGHSVEIPIQAIAAVVKLVIALYPVVINESTLGRTIASMLFAWLRQLDEKHAEIVIPRAEVTSVRGDRKRMISELRAVSLLLSVHAPEPTKAYLRALAAENDRYKVKEIRPLSATIARVAPQELADLVAVSLIESPGRRNSGGRRRDRALSFADSDYLPPSPAQTPFLDLLEAAPTVGLELVRKLVDEAVAFRSDGETPGANGFTLVFDDGPRFFPWIDTYYWSRDQADEYSMASGLMALEAWGHGRIQAGEPIGAVIAEVLGPGGSCLAFVLVAVDLLLSHWPASRELLVPFIACPELLATEHGRQIHDELTRTAFANGSEPVGRVRLADLHAKPSRGVSLERCLPGYRGADGTSCHARSLLSAAVAKIGAYSEQADFGDPAFMGAHALNLLDASNWISVEGGQQYRPPPAEATHLDRLNENRAAHIRFSEIEAKIQLAAHDSARGSSEVAREAAEFANGELPVDSEPDALKSKSTRLAATAMLVARDGDDDLLAKHEEWVRDVAARTLTQDDDYFSRSSLTITYDRRALAALALIHLWRRRGLKVDRDALVCAATRRDCCAVPAFSVALNVIHEAEPRLLKSAMRTAFKASRWRWHFSAEDEADSQTYEREKAEEDRLAVEAEIAWLDGGSEPPWPEFPEEVPTLRRPQRIRVSRGNEINDGEGIEERRSKPAANVHADSQAMALWLGLVTGNARAQVWSSEIVTAYVSWSARMNGLGRSPETEFDREPTEWNDQFYILVANEMMDAGDDRFGELLKQVEELPDSPFCDVSETIILAADVCYFNDSSRPSARPVELRRRLLARTLALRFWARDPRPGELSVDLDTGGVVARLLMNTHNPMAGTKSYLVPVVFDRVDPILDSIRPMLPGGPTAFIALCTMNTLLVAPRARHLDFVLYASEAWHGRLPTDTAMWIELGIGRKVVDWFDAAVVEQPSLLERSHPLRKWMDTVIGRLVSLGVSGAYQLERLVEQGR